MNTRSQNQIVPKPTELRTATCARCGKSWQAVIGNRGWNRCRHCGENHFAAEMLMMLERMQHDSGKTPTQGAKAL